MYFAKKDYALTATYLKAIGDNKMIFKNKGNAGLEIIYEPEDTDTDKRIVEQSFALLRNLLIKFSENK